MPVDPTQINNDLGTQLPTNNQGKITASVLRGALTTGGVGLLGLTTWIAANFAGVNVANTWTQTQTFVGQLIGDPAYIASGNGATTQTVSSKKAGETIDVKADFGAKGDALSFTDGTIAAGSNAFSSSSASFTQNDVGKKFILDFAGVGHRPLDTTISSVTDGHHVILADSATYDINPNVIFGITARPSQFVRGSGYVPGDTVTISGGTFTSATALTVSLTGISGATIAAGGSGGVANAGSQTSTCQVKGTTGTGDQFVANVVLTAGVATSVSGIAYTGRYSVNPTTTSSEPVTPINGCTGLSGAALNVQMGVVRVATASIGVYSALPSYPAASTSSGAGTGLLIYGNDAPRGGAFIYGTDDTQKISDAVTRENVSYAAGSPVCMHVPSGAYLIDAPITQFSRNVPGCVIGEAEDKSFFAMGPNFTGALFSVSDTWQGARNFGGFGQGLTSSGMAGAHFEKFSFGGRANIANIQSGIVFTDINDFGIVKDISAYQMNGSCFVAASAQFRTYSILRESKVSNFRAWTCGNLSNPAFLVNSVGTAGSDATNDVTFQDLDIEDSQGVGLAINSSTTTNSTRLLKFYSIRIESSLLDQFDIGDATLTGAVQDIKVYGLEMNANTPGAWNLNFQAHGTTYTPTNIYIQGSETLVQGDGINVAAGANITIDMPAISGITPLIVAGSSSVTGPIYFNVIGAQLGGINASVDPTALVFFPAYRNYYTSTDYAASVTANIHDGSSQGGNPVGVGGVDNQSLRFAATQVASGYASVIAGGSQNTASGSSATVGGGNLNVASGFRGTVGGGYGNTASGQYSLVAGGLNNIANGDYSVATGQATITRAQLGVRCHASGSLTDASGDANFCDVVIRCQAAATNASTCRMTADNGAATSNNVVNIFDKSAYTLTLDCVAIDRTTPGNNEQWATVTGLLTRGVGAATTAWTGSISTATAATRSNGSVTGSTLTLSADTTNGGLNATFASPTTNAALIDATCHVQAHQVQ